MSAIFLPGFSRPLGSNTPLTASCSSSARDDHCRASCPRFTQPMPCSPEIDPPTSPRTRKVPRRQCAPARPRRRRADQEGRVQVAVAGVTPAAGRQTVIFPHLHRHFYRRGRMLERDHDVLSNLPPVLGRDRIETPSRHRQSSSTSRRRATVERQTAGAHGLDQLPLNALGLVLGAVRFGDHHEFAPAGARTETGRRPRPARRRRGTRAREVTPRPAPPRSPGSPRRRPRKRRPPAAPSGAGRR